MRSTLASALVAVTAGLAVTAATARPAHAFDMSCWLGVGTPSRWPNTFNAVIDVPVYLNTSDSHGFQWSGYDSYDFVFSVWAAIHRWNEQAGSRIRLRYAGTVELGELDDESPPPGVYVYGVYPFEPGNQVWCSSAVGAALPLDRNSDGYTDVAWVAIPGASETCTPRTLPPAQLVDVLTHEFGHTFGRNDADRGVATCNQNHLTIMGSVLPDPTLFDQLELQSVYGKRTTGSTRRRVLHGSGGAWSAPTTVESAARISRPGPSSSTRNGALQMAWRHASSSGVMQMVRRMVSTSSIGTATTENIAASSPISIAHAPDGTALMAYVRENGLILPRVCYRISFNSGSTYGAETCNGDSDSNGVSVAFDPLTDMFVMGFTSWDGSIALRSVPSATAWMPARSATLSGRSGAQGVSIACADTVVSGNANCRVVYASRLAYGQPIAWFPMSVSFMGFGVGAEVTTSLRSQTVPAVAWFHDRFHMAFSYVDQYVYHYDMPRTGTSWTYRNLPVTPATSTSWVSAPHLASTTECSGDICATRLQLLWLQYQ